MTNMKNKIRSLSLFLIGLLLASGLTSCTRAARTSRHMGRADGYFKGEQYEKAEIEYLIVLRLDPQNHAATTRLGQIYYEEGRLTSAFAFLRKAQGAQPDDLDVRLKLGMTYFNLAGVKEARDEALYVLQKQPTNQEALLLLVESSATVKDLDDTEQRLQALMRQNGNGPALLLASGFLHLRSTDLKKAEGEIQQAIASDPKSSAAYQVLGTLHQLRNDAKQAEQAFKTASDLAPVRSARRLRYADFKIQSGDPDGGKKLLEEITQKAPDYLPAWGRLAELAFDQRKYQDCEKMIKKSLGKEPLNYEMLMLNGRLKLAQGDAAKAIIEFERMAKYYTRHPRVKYQLGLAHLLNNDLAKATVSLNEATALDPNFGEAILLLAQINLRRGDTASVINSLTQFTKQRPQVPQAHLLLAEAYRVQGDLNGAVAVYRRLNELFPKDSQPPLLMGLVLSQQGKKAEARKAFEKSLELAPDYLPPLEQLVEFDLADKQPAVALSRVEKLMEKYPTAPELQMLSARVFEARGETNRAEATLLKAIELQPKYRPAYLALAKIYVASNRYQPALDKLQGVLAANPKDVKALMQVGMIQSEMKDYAVAAQTYEKLLAVNPQFSPALNNLAYLYCEQLSRLDDAYKLARQARDLLPKDGTTADTLGWILYKRGEFSWAINLLQESAEKLPSNREVQYHLGMALYMMGAEGPARLALQRALQSGTDFAGKAEAERRLQVLAVDVKTADATAIAALEKRLADQPDDPVALGRLAAIQERDGAFEKARDLYERTLKQNPKSVPITIRLAQMYADHFNNTKKALELAKAARALAPDDATVAYTLGRLAFQGGDFKWSLGLLEEGARNLSRNPEVLYDLAWSQYSLGRTTEAEATMQKALQTGSAFVRSNDARRFLATSPLWNNPAKAKQASGQVQEMLKTDPVYVPALMAAAVIYEQQGNLNAAQQAFESALGRFPQFAPASKLLASLYAEGLGDFQKAYEPALKAREAYPDDPDVAKTLGIVTYRRGDYKRAAQLLKESAGKRTGDAELFYYLGMAHYQLKEKSDSKKALNQAVTLNANAKFVEEAKKVLAELK
jgi:tetratricopeptide (TPR) repeat protein